MNLGWAWGTLAVLGLTLWFVMVLIAHRIAWIWLCSWWMRWELRYECSKHDYRRKKAK